MEDVVGVVTPALFAMLLVAPLVHYFIDRHERRRTGGRALELFFYWQMGLGGALALLAGLGHVVPGHEEIADQIGFAQSPFQWEVGFADMAVGVLLLLATWKRGDFIIPALTAFAILYIGDGIGHIIEWVENDNTEPYNVYVIPTDIAQPILLIIFYVLLRRKHPETLEGRGGPHWHGRVARAE